MTPRIYLAGPMTGLTFQQADAWRKVVESELSEIICLSPMRWSQYMAGGLIDYTHDVREIIRRDYFDVQQSNLILANFEICADTNVSFGTVSELAWGYALRKPTVMVAPESVVYHHPWMLEMADYVRPTLNEGIATVRALLNL